MWSELKESVTHCCFRAILRCRCPGYPRPRPTNFA
jgi:hypothetical protein